MWPLPSLVLASSSATVWSGQEPQVGQPAAGMAQAPTKGRIEQGFPPGEGQTPPPAKRVSRAPKRIRTLGLQAGGPAQ